MKEHISKETYAETLDAILNTSGFYEKIPANVIKHIKSKASGSLYSSKIITTKEVTKQLSKESQSLYIYLYLKYMATEEEKGEYKKRLIENEASFENKKRYYEEIIAMDEKIDDEIMQKAREEAEEYVSKLLNKGQFGYKSFVNEKTQEILKEKYNIEWKPDDELGPTESVD